MLCCRVWLGAVALIGYIVLFNLLVVVAQMKLNRAHHKSVPHRCTEEAVTAPALTGLSLRRVKRCSDGSCRL